MSNAFIGYGSTLMVSDNNSPSDYVAIAELTSITPGPMSTGVVGVTHLTSPNTHQEKIPGIKDTGAIKIAGNYLPVDTTQGSTGKGLMALWKARTIANFKIVLNDGVSTTLGPFTGFVSALAPGDVVVDNKVAFTGEITPTTQGTLP